MRKTGKNLSKIGIMMVLCFLIPVFLLVAKAEDRADERVYDGSDATVQDSENDPNNIEASDEIVYSYGAVLTDEETYNDIPETSYPAEGYIPSKVDLSPDFPNPKNQGAQGSCVAWAVGYAYKGYQENVERG